MSELGFQPRDLPERFGDYRSVHKRHSRWCKAGRWERVFQAGAEDAEHEYGMSDTTIVRTHQHSAGAPKKTNQLNASAEVKAD